MSTYFPGFSSSHMQGQEAIPLKPQVSQTTGDLAFCSPVVSTFLPSSLFPYVSPSQMGWNRHSTTMLANGHTTAKSRRPLCIISKASSYHEKTSCKTLESEKLSFRCSQVNAPLPTGVATPHSGAMPAVKKSRHPRPSLPAPPGPLCITSCNQADHWSKNW